MSADRAALVAGILASPEDDAPRLVCADWFEEQGDPASVARAEFIRTQVERANLPPTDPRQSELEARELRLLKRHGAAWTGSHMLIWGGGNDTGVATGGRYDPASDSWTSMITASAPHARHNQSTVWTGQRMIIWGGEAEDSGTYTWTGGVYDPGTF